MLDFLRKSSGTKEETVYDRLIRLGSQRSTALKMFTDARDNLLEANSEIEAEIQEVQNEIIDLEEIVGMLEGLCNKNAVTIENIKAIVK